MSTINFDLSIYHSPNPQSLRPLESFEEAYGCPNDLSGRIIYQSSSMNPHISTELLRLEIASKREKWKDKQLNFSCYELEFSDLTTFLSSIKSSIQVEMLKIALLIHQERHYFTLYMELSPQRRSFLCMDSVTNTTLNRLYRTLKDHFSDTWSSDDHFFSDVRNLCIQSDNSSCPLFSLFLAEQCLKTPNLFDLLRPRATKQLIGQVVKWEDFPPHFLKHTQSISYVESNFPSLMGILGKTLLEYAVKKDDRFFNTSIYKKAERIRERALDLIKRLSEREATNVATLSAVLLFSKVIVIKTSLSDVPS